MSSSIYSNNPNLSFNHSRSGWDAYLSNFKELGLYINSKEAGWILHWWVEHIKESKDHPSFSSMLKLLNTLRDNRVTDKAPEHIDFISDVPDFPSRVDWGSRIKAIIPSWETHLTNTDWLGFYRDFYPSNPGYAVYEFSKKKYNDFKPEVVKPRSVQGELF